MTRNVKRLLALALPLSLAPMGALSEPLSPSWTETFVLPSRLTGADTASLLMPIQQDYYVGNFTGLIISTFSSFAPPISSPTANGNFAMGRVAAWIPVTQQYYSTTNPADPTGNAKTCFWQFAVLFDNNGVCTGTLNQAALGNQGVQCGVDTANSYIDPVTCQSQIVTYIQ
ncbi:hypothetical protein LXT21_08625 [Myxococcus sp. K38C18041901]|uniref:hypothetical protein n=1 Tax=Myxococcus guangdongensis TaxID=2906760 RepID=UPI0020A6F2F2|nr:hypothetical protein [Myxococcus guangdongensis]MCP3058833.1 hypothetical protein [Myxococcus guangdongensis]